jgi:hypothetical protein
MAHSNLSFAFKVDTIRARNSAPPQTFTNGFYKPPVRSTHYEQLDSTGWHLWTTSGVSQATQPTQLPTANRYSTSIFYDAVNTQRFLFHPADCRTVNISTIENASGENWGWQQLRFTEVDPSHSSLDHYGEQPSLCGSPGSYSPHFLPLCYQSLDYNTLCGLSGKMSLFIALTAFSCAPENMLVAIQHRLNLNERRWVNALSQNWGVGRRLQSHAIQVKANS